MSKRQELDYLIIGAGPAGLQLAYFLERHGRDYLVLEAHDRAGVFFERYPRHGKLLSINKVYSGYEDRESQLRYDWNSLLCDDDEMALAKYSKRYFPDGSDYARYLRDYAVRFKLKIQYDTRVANIAKNGRFLVTDEVGHEYSARCLVVATGVWKPYIPEIPGIEETENYSDCSIDPEDYVNQRVLIIGKGNSAFETANHLCEVTRVTHLCSPSSVKLAWKTHFFGHLRAVNNEFLDTYILKGQNSVLDANIDRIERVDGEYRVSITFTHAQGQQALLAYDRVLCCTGFRWDPSFFDESCRPELAVCDRLPAMTSSWESPNVEDLHFAGTIMQVRDLHKTMSNVLHGFRFNVKALSHMIEERYSDAPWPCTELPMDAAEMSDHVIRRVSTNAGLMHQPGFLCDVIVVDEQQGTAKCFDCMPVDYVHDSCFGKHDHYYVVTMEYGDIVGDPLNVAREPDPTKAYLDVYLHPRIQRFSGSRKLGEHHISESLENDWRIDDHPGERPLIREMHFVGQKDDTQFQQTHARILENFFRTQMHGISKNGAACAACPEYHEGTAK